MSLSSCIGSSGSCGMCCGGVSCELDAGVLCVRCSLLFCCRLLSLVCDLIAVLFSPLGDGGIAGGNVFGGMLDCVTGGDLVRLLDCRDCCESGGCGGCPLSLGA